MTDRVVLDRQLQNTVASFEKTKGVVKKIDGTSRDLKAAIQGGARIIITTIQKFGTDHLQELSGQSGRQFAVIVDEAHSFQSGKSAQAMTDALTREASDSEDVEDLILEYQRARGPYAKAMVVTQSREHALRYWQGLGRYIEKQGYGGLNALVAFSDTLEIDGVPWTEAEANGFPETELPRRFEGDEFQILVVAEKYQTGFDQPKLCGMYVDRPLHGLRAVQTLSRLNRAALGKRRTYVLDFRNTQEEIQSAFKPFFEVTQLEDRSDPNQIYDLSQRIMSASYVDPDEVEAFSRLFFRVPSRLLTAWRWKGMFATRSNASCWTKMTPRRRSSGNS